MINRKLIGYLHSVYPELPFDISYVKGYSDDEIGQIERLYDIKVSDQLYDFLRCMGRCSGGLFGDLPLLFYRDRITVRDFVLYQSGHTEDLYNWKYYEWYKLNPFFFSIESETQHYFLLTRSDNPNLVYHYDENEETVEPTQWSFNEYLRNSIDEYTRRYQKHITPDFHGELIII